MCADHTAATSLAKSHCGVRRVGVPTDDDETALCGPGVDTSDPGCMGRHHRRLVAIMHNGFDRSGKGRAVDVMISSDDKCCVLTV